MLPAYLLYRMWEEDSGREESIMKWYYCDIFCHRCGLEMEEAGILDNKLRRRCQSCRVEYIWYAEESCKPKQTENIVSE